VTQKFIHIVPIRFNDVFLLDSLRMYLSSTFQFPTRIENKQLNIDSAYDPLRNQHNSSYLLAQLIDNLPDDAARILGVCSFDIFIPILTFVFGEAQLEGVGSIVSTRRLINEFYGGTPDKNLLMETLTQGSNSRTWTYFQLIPLF